MRRTTSCIKRWTVAMGRMRGETSHLYFCLQKPWRALATFNWTDVGGSSSKLYHVRYFRVTLYRVFRFGLSNTDAIVLTDIWRMEVGGGWIWYPSFFEKIDGSGYTGQHTKAQTISSAVNRGIKQCRTRHSTTEGHTSFTFVKCSTVHRKYGRLPNVI